VPHDRNGHLSVAQDSDRKSRAVQEICLRLAGALSQAELDSERLEHEGLRLKYADGEARCCTATGLNGSCGEREHQKRAPQQTAPPPRFVAKRWGRTVTTHLVSAPELAGSDRFCIGRPARSGHSGSKVLEPCSSGYDGAGSECGSTACDRRRS